MQVLEKRAWVDALKSSEFPQTPTTTPLRSSESIRGLDSLLAIYNSETELTTYSPLGVLYDLFGTQWTSVAIPDSQFWVWVPSYGKYKSSSSSMLHSSFLKERRLLRPHAAHILTLHLTGSSFSQIADFILATDNI